MSITRAVIALTILSSLTAAVHYYLWARLVKAPLWPAPWMNVATALIIGLAITVPLAFVASRAMPRSLSGPLAWLAFSWMGAVFLLVVILLPSELVRLAVDYFGSRGDLLASPERRLFVSRAIAGTASAGALGLGAVALHTALRPVAVVRRAVALPRLPEALEGLRIAQLTDIHVGPTIGRAFIEQLVEKTNALEPDVIAITGDLVDGSVEELREHVAPLADLRARHGVYFCTGNHEYYSGADEWIEHLESLGVRVLKNEHELIEHEGAKLAIAGVHDWTSEGFGHGPDLPAALEGRDPEAAVLLLAHQPKQIDEAAALGVDLMISGHTHGGQMMPFNLLVRLQQPYVAGLHTHGASQLYVSPGTGYWGPPMRLGVPAEITELVLARG